MQRMPVQPHNRPMKVLDLQCTHLHTFEGWFASEDDFQDQLARGLVSCPVCNETAVVKLLSAPRLNLGGTDMPSSPPSVVAVARTGEVVQAAHAEHAADGTGAYDTNSHGGASVDGSGDDGAGP